jgi:hypothetical protein
VVILKNSWVDDLLNPGDDEYTTDAIDSANALQVLYEAHESRGLMVVTNMCNTDAAINDFDDEHLMPWAESLG